MASHRFPSPLFSVGGGSKGDGWFVVGGGGGASRTGVANLLAPCVAGADGKVAVLDKAQFSPPDSVHAAAVCPNAANQAVCAFGTSLALVSFTAQASKVERELKLDHKVGCVAFLGKRVLAGCEDGKVRVIAFPDLAKVEGELQVGADGCRPHHIAPHPSLPLAFVCTNEEAATGWDVATRKRAFTLRHATAFKAAHFAHGDSLVSLHVEPRVQSAVVLWGEDAAAKGRKPAKTLVLAKTTASAFAVSACGGFAAVGTSDGAVVCVGVPSLAKLSTHAPHSWVVTALCFVPVLDNKASKADKDKASKADKDKDNKGKGNKGTLLIASTSADCQVCVTRPALSPSLLSPAVVLVLVLVLVVLLYGQLLSPLLSA